MYDSEIFGPADFFPIVFFFGVLGTVSGGAWPTGVPHSVNSGCSPRQISVGPRLRIRCRSVVTVGIVQVSVTLFPLRDARTSVGGVGKLSDGGSGGPIFAHAVRIDRAANNSSSFLGRRLMQKETGYQNRKWERGDSPARVSRGCLDKFPVPPPPKGIPVQTSRVLRGFRKWESDLQNVPAQILIFHDVG